MNQSASEASASAPRVRPDEKYDTREGAVLLSGTEALARLPLEQRWRDQRADLNTGGFISGYRGSPLGGYDQELWRIEARLEALNICFQPGVNEDLAATAVWGTQFLNLYPGANVDGVFGIWYGKSPGVDRSGDAFQHANTAGTAPKGGVVALVGDDHACKSSSRTAQSDFQLMSSAIPILYPSCVQEILDYGLHAIAMSRYSGCWVALKLVTDVVESTSLVEVGSDRMPVSALVSPQQPAEGLHIQKHEPALSMESRLYEYRIPAALQYARANQLNRIHYASESARVGIISAGKSWSDLQGALDLLGLDEPAARAAGVQLLKLGLTWPVDPEIVRVFVGGLDTVLVVEEKRPFIEDQIKAIVQDLDVLNQPRVIGKKRPMGNGAREGDKGLLPLTGELNARLVARALADILGLPPNAVPVIEMPGIGPLRLPNFCSGCPHSTSTVLPEGSRAMAGIGCHAMAVWLRPEYTGTYSQMGGEGAFWVGQAPFTDEKHVFVNLGDGTFFHSGSLALRQAVSAKLRVTYKLLFNGHVSMTGGQPHDGDLTVRRIVDIAQAEGIQRIAVVSDDPKRHTRTLPANVSVHHRTDLDSVQRTLREFEGVSVLVYDQACATERRRVRKKHPELDVAKRTFINAEVCEGCGDCGKVSNCMSIEPLETELGRKRRINQSSCNKDFSCVEGFCPSFVTVHGGALKRPARSKTNEADWPELPVPALPQIGAGFNMLVAGIGGTGIVTIGTVLGRAARNDGIRAVVLDVTGLAQKYGTVMSHVRFAQAANQSSSARLGLGEADVMIGCDLIVAAGQEALSKTARDKTFVVVNTAVTPTSEFPKSPDWSPDVDALLMSIRERAGAGVHALDATRLATALMGDAIAINMFLLGYAWQAGRVPLSLAALSEAIEQNGVEVSFNRSSFEWGRRAAVDAAAVDRAAFQQAGTNVLAFVPKKLSKVEDIVADRARRLAMYQDDTYAQRYVARMKAIEAKDRRLDAGGRLARAAARGYYKLLANKDEFEVARLYSTPDFRKQLEDQFDGNYRLHFHIGTWPFAKRDAQGQWRKREVGPWMLKAMGVLQHLRGIRGTWMDPFRHNPERRLALHLLQQYEESLQLIVDHATLDSLDAAIELASLPDMIRGYGHIREASARTAELALAPLRARLHHREPISA